MLYFMSQHERKPSGNQSGGKQSLSKKMSMDQAVKQGLGSIVWVEEIGQHYQAGHSEGRKLKVKSESWGGSQHAKGACAD